MNPYDPIGLEPWQARRAPGSVDADFEVELHGDAKHGANGLLGLSVLGDGKMWKRRAIKGLGAPSQHEVTWLVGELDGVRCYAVQLDGRVHVVMTTGDLYP